MSDRTLVFDDFADRIGDTFTVREEGAPAVGLELRHAEPLDPKMAPSGARPPFSLMFITADPRILPQRIYRMAHDALGEVSIFIVPVAKDEDGVRYQATFN